jgi:hypothetical protein
VQREALRLVTAHKHQRWQQTIKDSDAGLIELKPTRNDGRRGAPAPEVDHLATVSGCALAKAAGACPRIIAEGV